MKLLFDENLSRKLVARIADLYPGSAHLSHLGLLETADATIWDYAKAHGFKIVTTDSDFFERAVTYGPPPKVVWLRSWTHPTRDAERVLRREALRITDFAENQESGLLVLDK